MQTQNERNNEKEHLKRCLAITLLRLALTHRRRFLIKFQDMNGKKLADEIRAYMTEEHDKKKTVKLKAKQEIDKCLKKNR